MDGPGHIQPKLRGQIMSKRAPIHATWAVCAPPGPMSGCPGHRGPGLNFLALAYNRLYGTFIRLWAGPAARSEGRVVPKGLERRTRRKVPAQRPGGAWGPETGRPGRRARERGAETGRRGA